MDTPATPPPAAPPAAPPAPPPAPPTPPTGATYGPATVGGAMLTVSPAGWCVPLPPGHTLLRAALAAGVRLPSSCRNGTCRACMCRLAAGRVAYTIDWPGLLADEKAEGWVLPCVATSDADVTLDAPAAARLFG